MGGTNQSRGPSRFVLLLLWKNVGIYFLLMIIMVEWTPKLVTIYKRCREECQFLSRTNFVAVVKQIKAQFIHIKYHVSVWLWNFMSFCSCEKVLRGICFLFSFDYGWVDSRISNTLLKMGKNLDFCQRAWVEPNLVAVATKISILYQNNSHAEK